jgi:hypothetical protein
MRAYTLSKKAITAATNVHRIRVYPSPIIVEPGLVGFPITGRKALKRRPL